MVRLGEILKHPDELHVLLKMKVAVKHAEKQITLTNSQWGFCYSLLNNFSNGVAALLLQPFDPQLRNAVCLFYLVLRALDTVEDDTSIPTEVKLPILIDFHRHVYDCDWRFSCGTKDCKILMDQFHHVSTAFLQLEKGYQETIVDITKTMGTGMAKFICKEVETMDDYGEYCHHVAGLVGIGLFKLFKASGKQNLGPENLSNEMGIFLQKTNIIRDYLEDISEIPKPRMFWPREIWSKYVNKLEFLVCGPLDLKNVLTSAYIQVKASGKQNLGPENLSNEMGIFLQKTNIIRDYLEDISEIPKPRMLWPREIRSKYVNKLEDLQYEENSANAVQCLNEMVTDALRHVEDCLKHMSALKDNAVLRFCAIRPVLAMGTLASCYNNIDVFKTGVKLRSGLAAKIYDRTRTMTDVYNAFFEFASVMKSKAEMDDPHSMETLSSLNQIQDISRKSGFLNDRKFYIIRSEQTYNSALIMVLFILLFLLYAYRITYYTF